LIGAAIVAAIIITKKKKKQKKNNTEAPADIEMEQTGDTYAPIGTPGTSHDRIPSSSVKNSLDRQSSLLLQAANVKSHYIINFRELTFERKIGSGASGEVRLEVDFLSMTVCERCGKENGEEHQWRSRN
jgi:hypothetical protein